jgi:hypothetical protein
LHHLPARKGIGSEAWSSKDKRIPLSTWKVYPQSIAQTALQEVVPALRHVLRHRRAKHTPAASQVPFFGRFLPEGGWITQGTRCGRGSGTPRPRSWSRASWWSTSRSSIHSAPGLLGVAGGLGHLGRDDLRLRRLPVRPAVGGPSSRAPLHTSGHSGRLGPYTGSLRLAVGYRP